MKTHQVIDETYTVEEGQGDLVGTEKECQDFLEQQNQGGIQYGMRVVPLTLAEIEAYPDNIEEMKQRAKAAIMRKDKTIPEFIRKTDWEMLRKQKLSLINTVEHENDLTQEVRDDLEGIIGLLDALQDYASDDLGMGDKFIFNIEPEECQGHCTRCQGCGKDFEENNN